ncbi:MAG: spondin domain-containing protein [Chloroflexi bacterium]|nr:spondin domain-containing protein [Chloroflexota bacterium]
MHSVRKGLLAGLSASLLLVSLTGAAAAHGQTATYRVTITNLTDGQPFTPPLVALHRPNVDVFSVGSKASFGVKEIAENGNLMPLLSALGSTKGVGAVEAAGAPVVPAGSIGETDPALGFSSTSTLTITAPKNVTRFSWVSMLLCTNDGFTGVDTVRLPKHVGDSVSRSTAGYETSTEMNTEEYGDIVMPCQILITGTDVPGTAMSNPALAENGVIRHHEGIDGIADLIVSLHGWENPVATIVVERIG